MPFLTLRDNMSTPKDIRPSPLFLRFFRWFCDPLLVEDIEGDLLERFEIRSRKKGNRKAKWLFIKDVLQLFKPELVRFFKETQNNNRMGMYKNYFKTARRNLFKQKMYSAIKIGGFALGLSVCLLISLFIRDELTYDRHIPGHENIYMTVKEYHEPDGVEKYTWMPPPFGRTMLKDYPEVEQAGRILLSEGFGAGKANIRIESNPTNFHDDGFAYADQSFLDLFQYPMVYGQRENALAAPNSIVLTRSKSDMLFPGINPIGKLVYIDNNTEFPMTVGGVIEDIPENSTVKFSYLMSMTEREFWQGEQNSWGSNNYQTFVKLRSDANVSKLDAQIDEMAEKYVLPAFKNGGFTNAEELVAVIQYSLVRMKDLHLYSADVVDPFQKSDINYVLIFALIATFILVLACVNFINLSTAKSANRAKEVGLRKTVGSTRGHLITQFLTESIFYSLLSFVLALGLSSLLLPFFNLLAEKNIALPWTDYWFVPSLIGASAMVGILAGLYPAFYLSAFRPSAVLKGKVSMGSKSGRLRNILVIFQFTASIVLVIGTFVVYQQMQYILNRDLGFNKEQVLLIESPYLAGLDQMETFRSELNRMPEVSNVSYSGYLPVSGTNRNGNIWWLDGRTKLDPGGDGQNWIVDHYYLETLEIDLLQGRNFSKEIRSDSAAMIINESMAKELGISDDPLGKRITNDSDNRFVFTVIGVVEDFHFNPLNEEVEPLAMRLNRNYTTASVKLSTDQLTGSLEKIRSLWTEIAPNQPFIYSFLDQRFEQMYKNVSRIQNILMAFSVLAVLIACLGLFGLSVFMVEQRNKEISVRLVLGAKMGQIISLLGINFMKPILIAILIAVPVAWYIMKGWVEGFVDPKGLNAGIFIAASLATLLIALITISFQSVKAAINNPVNGLRNE